MISSIRLGGLETVSVRVHPDGAEVLAAVVLLHGFSMSAEDLAPFGASMRLPAQFFFPQGPIDLSQSGGTGRAWWHIDVAARQAAIEQGHERDLAHERPPGLAAARAMLGRMLGEIAARWPGRPIVLGGFSQGAILSLDATLRAVCAPDRLVLLSGARVTLDEWEPLWPRLRGLPIFQSHGRSDRNLSFTAAEELHRRLVVAEARATFFPFDGGHEIPLTVLRQLKKFIQGALPQTHAGGEKTW